jgi:hypothetical protein
VNMVNEKVNKLIVCCVIFRYTTSKMNKPVSPSPVSNSDIDNIDTNCRYKQDATKTNLFGRR